MEPIREPTVATISSGMVEGLEHRPEVSRPVVDRSTSRRLLVTMFVRELQELRAGMRYRATWLLIVGLMASSALISAARFRAEKQIYAELESDYSAELSGRVVADLAKIQHPAIKPPWKLAFLVEGGQPGATNVYLQALNPWSEPEVESWQTGRILGATEPLDWLFVIRVILSLLAFMLGYDAFCGSRQRAAVSLVLSYPIARWQVFATKLLAIWACLAGPFTLGAPVSLLILSGYGGLRFTSTEWSKIALVMVLGLWASSVFVLIALAVSALSRQAARSLAILALIWVAAVVVIPAASGVAIHAIQPLLAGPEADRQMQTLRQQAEIQGAGTWRSRLLAQTDGYANEKQATEKQNGRYWQQEKLRRAFIASQLDQIEHARRLGGISPMALVQDLAERVVGTGPSRDRAFFSQAWAFRSDLEAHIEALDQADSESPHLMFIKDYMSQRAFDAAAVPRFEFVEASLKDGLKQSFGLLLALSLATAVLAGAAMLFFARFDVG